MEFLSPIYVPTPTDPNDDSAQAPNTEWVNKSIALAVGKARFFDTRADVVTASIPATIEHIYTGGYSAVGDNGGAHYIRVATEPAHAAKIQSADGAWWRLAEWPINPMMFGAAGDNVTDDKQALLDMFAYVGVQASPNYTQSWPVTGLGYTYCTSVPLTPPSFIDLHNINFRALAGASWAGGNGSAYSYGNNGVLTLNGGFQRLNTVTVDCGRVAGCQGIYASGPNYQNIWANILVKHWTTNGNGIVLNNYSLTEARNIDCLQFMDGDAEYKIASYRKGCGMLLANQADSIFISCNWANADTQLYIDGASHHNRFQDCHPYCVSDGHATVNQVGIVCDGSWNEFNGTYLDVCTFRVRTTATTLAGYPAITITNTTCLYNTAHSTFGAWFIFETQLANTPIFDIKMANNHTPNAKPFSFVVSGAGAWAASARRIQTLNSAIGDAELHEPGGATARFLGSIDMLGVGYLTGYTTTSITDTASARTLSLDDSGKLVLMTLNNAITITAPKSVQTGLDCYIYCPNHSATIIAEGGGSINGQTTGIALEQNKLYKLICYYGSGNNAQYGLMGLGGSGGGPVDLSDYYTKEEVNAGFQPLDAELQALAGLTSAADKLPYFTGAGTADTTTLSAFSRGLIDNTSAAAWRTDLGIAIGSQIQSWDIVLDILSSVAPAADTIPYFTDSGHGDTTAFTAVGRDLVGATTQADAQAAIGLAVGSNVQAYGDNLEAIRALPTSNDTLTYWTGAGDANLTAITEWARNWLALGDSETAATFINAQTHYPALDFLGTVEPNVGDLIVGTASGFNILAGGAFGKILVSDPATGGGMGWQTPSADLFGLGDMANQNSNAVDITGGSISGLSSLDAGSISTSGLAATGGIISNVSITNLPYPTDPNDAASKQFVIDSIGAGTTSPELLAIASLTSAQNTFPVFTGHGTATLASLAPWAGGFLGITTAADAQDYLGLTPDADIMAYDANLVAISTLAQTKGNLMVGTGSGWDVLPVDTHDGWVLQVDSSTVSGYSFVNPGTFGLSDRLTNLANATLTAGQIITYAGDDDWGAITPTAFGSSVLTTPDADTFRAGMGLRVNLELQGHSTILDQISGWIPAPGDLLIGQTGSVGLLSVSDDNKVLVCDSTSPIGVAWKDLSLDNTLPAALTALNNLDTTAGGLLHYSGLNEPDLVPINDFAKNILLPLSNSAAWRDALGLIIDAQVQRHNDKLDAFAALGWAEHKGLVFTGGSSVGTFDLSDAMIALLASASNEALLDTLGLTVGSDVQEWHAGLDDLGGLEPTADGTLAVWFDGHWVTFEPGQDTQILQANSLADGGLQWIDLFSSGGGDGALSESLGILGQVTPAADRLPYFSSSTTAAITPLTAFGRSLIDDVDASHARTTLGLGIGVDVQAYSTKLDALANMTWAANKGLMAIGSNAVSTFDLSPLAQTLLAETDAASMRTTLGLANVSGTSLLPRSYLSGFTLSNNTATPNTKITIAAGACRDDTNGIDIKALTALTLDAATTGANGLASGTLAANTWYHVFAIMKDDGTVACFASTSITPTLPTGYTYKRRLGSVKTDASSRFRAFKQYGDVFRWVAPTQHATSSQVTTSTASVVYTMDVPTGLKVEWAGSTLAVTNGQVGLSLSDPDVTDPGADWYGKFTFFLVNTHGFSANVMTNTSGQVRCTINRDGSASVTVNPISFATFGWRDRRGQDD